MMYYHIFAELRRELGEARAADIMKRAIYRRGTEVGRAFARYAPADLDGLRRAFVGMVPDEGRMFAPEVTRADAGGLDIKFHRCPLKEAWQEAGVAESDIATLCHIAGRVDNGTFEGAGFAFGADTWTPGAEGCCYLHIRPGPAARS
jgi:predicted ArsR family transcriptional regulator